MDLHKMTMNTRQIRYRTLLLFLMVFLSSGLLRAQDVRHITGTVTDIAGVPVTGAGIIAYGEKGRTYGTTADAEGRFDLDLPSSISSFQLNDAPNEPFTTGVVSPATYLSL